MYLCARASVWTTRLSSWVISAWGSVHLYQQSSPDSQLALLFLNTSAPVCLVSRVWLTNHQNRSAAVMEPVGPADAPFVCFSMCYWQLSATFSQLWCWFNILQATRYLIIFDCALDSSCADTFKPQNVLNVCMLMFLLQIATVKSQVGLEMFRKNVLRKFWSLGEEFSIDGKLLKDEKIPRSK